MKNISIIVCCDERGGFAKNKQIPWINEEFSKTDLKNFRLLTTGNTIIMGRNTYNEIAELKPIKLDLLPNRTSFVITSNPKHKCKGAKTFASLHQAIEKSKTDVFIIGGYQLFVEAIKICNKMHISFINHDYNCDQFFPGELIDDSWDINYEEAIPNKLLFATYTKNNTI
jgi:dihydrofolate reductase (trimethoprim resistance protein)